MALSLIIRSLLPTKTGCAAMMVPRIFGEQIYDNYKSQGLVNYVQNRGAARKGKRIQRAREARLRANKRRLLEAQNPKPKKAFKKNVRVDTSQFKFQSERQLDLTLPPPPEDDVYFMEKFKRRRFSLEEILEYHRQAVHPDVSNEPDALVSATIELNLKMKIKKKKYVEVINSTTCYPNLFQYQTKPRKIVALCKNEMDQIAAREAGAIVVGSSDVANLLKTNQLTQRDFDHIVCHEDFLVEFAAVKGMKNSGYFPTRQRGNFGNNIVELVKFFKDGIDYSLRKTQEEPSYGFIDCYFGRLNMSDEQLNENLKTLFESINRFKPLNLADGKQFFERVTITTPATEEMFLLKFWDILDEYKDPEVLKLEEEEEEKKSEASN